jgi:hypothetical protein
VLGLVDRHGGLDAPDLGPLLDGARRRFDIVEEAIPA